MPRVDFADITAPTPVHDEVEAKYHAIGTDLDNATDADAFLGAVKRWDTYLRQLDTWQALVRLRFHQDTTNDEYKRMRNYCDELTPKLTELAVQLKCKVLASPHRDVIATEFGTTALELWNAHVTTYDPAIEQDAVAELKLSAEYIELTASAKIPLRGKTYSISEIAKFGQELDRDLRHEARKSTWQWFDDNRDQLDRIFDDQVKLRTQMATKLNFEDFVGLGYQRMCRLDYDREDVDRFRDGVREHVVPLCIEIRKQQSQRLGVENIFEWDLPLHGLEGNPKPRGDHDWMLDRAQEMFDQMRGGLETFFRMMRGANLLDLKIRDGKGGGGFCTDFASYGLPFIFANFNGTKGDVEVFTHEVGHAYQMYQSRHQPLVDYFWPTLESCEIHSMSLEFLTWPHMELFFGDDAQRFRQIHLTEALLFIPYGVAVDHFQHTVYENPNASPDKRHQMWQELEQTYLPGRDYGDMHYPAMGGRWQLQRHIYLDPFYYIDYALAQICALQFWQRSQADYQEALDAYVALCRRGGEAPFQDLVKSAGLKSPFEAATLERIVDTVRRELAI